MRWLGCFIGSRILGALGDLVWRLVPIWGSFVVLGFHFRCLHCFLLNALNGKGGTTILSSLVPNPMPMSLPIHANHQSAFTLNSLNPISSIHKPSQVSCSAVRKDGIPQRQNFVFHVCSQCQWKPDRSTSRRSIAKSGILDFKREIVSRVDPLNGPSAQSRIILFADSFQLAVVPAG